MDSDSKLFAKLKRRTRERVIYESLEEKAGDIIKFFSAHAPYYYDHGINHSKRIINNLDELLTGAAIRRLNYLEAFILLCSAWLHDIGYVVNKKGNKELSDQEIQDQHHELSEYLINKHYQTLGFEDKSTADLIGRICATHRRRVIISKKLPREEEAFKGKNIRSHFLAALISLADALDTDNRRAPEIRSDYVTKLPEESKRHWKVCQHIGGIKADPDKARIIVDSHYNKKLDCDDIMWKLRSLQDELDRVSPILVQNNLPYVKIVGRLQYRGKVHTHDMMQLKREEAEKPTDTAKSLDLYVEYYLDIDHDGNAWIKRKISIMNPSSSYLKEKEHRAFSYDSSAHWDWEKDIVVQGGTIKQIEDRPMYKRFFFVFPRKGIAPNRQHDYTIEYPWPGMFPSKKEWYSGSDNSIKITYNLILPKTIHLKKMQCIERFGDGRTGKCAKVLDEGSKPIVDNKISYSITVEKEERYSITELHWEVK